MTAKEAIGIIIELEGGYVNDPRDPGGETKYGISKRAFPELDIKSLTVEQATDIYKKLYWDAVKGDQLPYPLNLLVFDFAVNSGPVRAIKTLQATLKVAQDGAIGPLTLKAAQNASTHVCAQYLTNRKNFLQSLNKPHFIDGWMNRLFKLALRA